MLPLRRQNETLNAIKAIACVCVVFMHCEFPGALGVYVQAISRWCVPFFFMIAGYFCVQEDGVTYCSAGKVRAKFIHILKLTGWTAAFYFFVLLAASICSERILPAITPMATVNLLVFNVPILLPSQMWFLFALAFVYLFVYCLLRLRLSWVILSCGIAMVVVYLCLAQGLYVVGICVPNYYYKNWFVEGMAFFSLGVALRKCLGHRIISCSRGLIIVVIISTAFCVVERKLIGRDFGVQICSVVQVVSIFALALLYATDKETWLSKLGKHCSMLVYVLHPFVWHSVEELYRRMTWDDNLFALYVMPILVVALTFVLSGCVNVMNRRVRGLYA